MNDISTYEPQHGPGRRCGAATLTMIYRDFDLEIPQETTWSELCGDANVTESSTPIRTLHLARHARRHGLVAIPCRLESPWEFLERFFENKYCTETRAILNHRLEPNSSKGHFTVPVAMDVESEAVFLHDPQFGPACRMTRAELLSLWTPRVGRNEISGNIVLLLAKAPSGSATCNRCGEEFGMLKFLHENPTLFRRRFCPSCDAVF